MNKLFELIRDKADRFSHDDTIKVGAVILDSSKEIISWGVNNFDCDDDDFNQISMLNKSVDKYSLIRHAESNAIDKAIELDVPLEGKIIVTNLFPCFDCAKKIVENNISKVVTISRSPVGSYYNDIPILEFLKKYDVQVDLYDNYYNPVKMNFEGFIEWALDVKYHKYFNEFNYYLWGGITSWPKYTVDIDILISKRNGVRTKLNHLESILFDFKNSWDKYGIIIDPCYMRKPQWIADYPRNEDILRQVERKTLTIFTSDSFDVSGVPKDINFRRIGKMNCYLRPCFTDWWENDDEKDDLIKRWVYLDANFARLVDLRKIIKYYENNNKINIEDFLNEFQEYSGY
jgi:deoxycytidylate deaminase